MDRRTVLEADKRIDSMESSPGDAAGDALPRWVLKDSAGWGGHGITFHSSCPAHVKIPSRPNKLVALPMPRKVLQRYVAPPLTVPPLGRKFSVRL